MKFCSKCGKEIVDEAVVCPNCGCAVGVSASNQTTGEVNIGFCVLAALIPLFGLIYWPVKHKENPKGAQTVGITAIVAWVVYMLLMVAPYYL